MTKYRVQPGDTAQSISRLFNIRTEQLESVNPNLVNGNALMAGQTIEIPEGSRMRPLIDTNGYFDAQRDPELLRDIFPYLTYLSVLNCRATADGDLICGSDGAVVDAALSAGVAPIMVVSNFVPLKGYSEEITSSIFSNPVVQQTLLDNILERLAKTRYYGINLDFEVIPYLDYNEFAAFVQRVTFTLHPRGYYVMLTLRARRIIGRLEEHAGGFPAGNYEFIADRFIIKSSEVVCDPASGRTPIDSVQYILDFTIGPFSSSKVLIAYPNCCQIWTYPAEPYQQPIPIYYEKAALLADQDGGLQYDPESNMYYFNCIDENGMYCTIWCGNVMASRDTISLINSYNLGGVSFRPADFFSLATYQLFDAFFIIRKVT